MIRITFLPTTNRQDWTETAQIKDEETGAAINITGATIFLSVRDPKSEVEVLNASVGNRITLTDPTQGIFEWTFTDNDMSGVVANTYDVGLVMVLAGAATQLMLGSLPVLDGIVAAP